MPKAEFVPSGSEVVNRYLQSPAFARDEARVDEGLRSRGLPDYRSLLEEKMSGAEAAAPGRLTVEVEVGKPRVPTLGRFDELLAHLIRIAQINLEANPPTSAFE